MEPTVPSHDWARAIRDHAARTHADLPPGAIAELAAHLDDLYAAARQTGATDADARARALRALEESPLAAVVAEPHARFRRPIPDHQPPGAGSPLHGTSIAHALRLAVRQFVHQRSFAVVTVLVLGLGIGASVAVYSVIDAVLLRPLPYTAPDRLVMFWETNHEKALNHEGLSPVNFMDYRALPAFSGAAAWWRPDISLTEPGTEPVRIKTIETSANLFALLGVHTALGPGFPGDGPLYNPDLQAVISDRLWRARFHADPALIGRQIALSGRQYTVVGVMPPRFDFPGEIDIWERLRWDLAQHSRAAHFMEGVARLAPGVDQTGATAALTALTTRLGVDFASTNRAWGVQVTPLLDDMLGYYRPALVVLAGAVGLLLAIACLNVGSLLLTRAIARHREIALRTALGATPRHLLVQLLAEGAVLSAAGAIAGIVAAAVALPLIVSLTPVRIPRLEDVALNGRALGATLAIAVVTTMVFGLVPAFLVRRRAMASSLRAGDRGTTRGTTRLYHLLVAGEVALAAALLVCCGLLVRTVVGMTTLPTGVTNNRVLLTRVQMTAGAYPDWPKVVEAYNAVLADLRQRPGIRAAGASNFLPLEAGWRIPFGIEGQPPVRPEEAPLAQYHSVMEGYFDALGAKVTAGRLFTPQDGVATKGVVIVNEAFAARYFPGQAAVGTHLTTTSHAVGPLGTNLLTDGRLEVIGVIADVRDAPISQPIEPAIYFTARQYPFRTMTLAVDAVDPGAGQRAIQAALHDQAPSVALDDVRTWADRLQTLTAEPRLLMTLLVFFGVLAALLAALGVYGLSAWTVALRRRELAIRLTLGARPAGIGWRTLRQSIGLVIAGLGGGWVVVKFAERALTRVLFDVAPGDPGTLTVAAMLILTASLAASLPAAWRAMRVDPVEGLRE